MKISLEKDSKIKKKYKVIISKNEISEKNEQLLKEKLPSLKIDGFRKGHVPIDIARKMLVGSFFKTNLSEFIDFAAKKIVEENKLSVVSSVFEENGKIDPESDISFFLVFELWPEIPEIKYHKITVTKPIISISNDEIDKQILIMADSLATLKKDENQERKTQINDVLDIDYLGKIDDIAFKGGTAKNQMLQLGSNTFIPGFEEQLIDCNVNSEVKVSVQFPNDYHSEDIKGKNAIFNVKINAIYNKVMPEINDDFAKQFKEETLASLKEKIQSVSSEEYITQLKSILQSRVIEQIAHDNDFDLPESILTKQIEERKKSLIKNNFSKPEKEQLSSKEIEKQAIIEAKKALKLAYLKRSWVDKYHIEVNDSDFEMAIAQEAKRNGSSYQELYSAYNQYPNLKQYALAAIEENKIFNEIFNLLKIKEKPMTKNEVESYLEKLKTSNDIM